MTESAPNTVLDEVLDPFAECLTADVARKIVALRAPDSFQGRMQELAEKCGAGSLSPEERAAYEAYVSAGNFIAVLQSKARQRLQDERVA